MSTSAPNNPARLTSSNAVRVRHSIAAVIAQYIQDLTHRPAAA